MNHFTKLQEKERNEVRQNLGQLISARRSEFGFSQEECANHCNLPLEDFVKLEQGELPISYEILKQVQFILFPGILPSDLFFRSLPEDPSYEIQIIYHAYGYADVQASKKVH